ncbi:oxygenase [Micromonospora sp. BL1]|uniref:TauD/TfdA family dioxygenase n=1 Tax=unclassified Micromonospora TaxID=2617518 RepID=UPI000EF60CF1|nr:TauD/TfdA family dioxygenase [Micromonospora sp. BL1]NED50671.1 oxygenase [Micromonospora aurantiaca]RLQ03534.1 oxygenase [Micromonospora sp. BL1]
MPEEATTAAADLVADLAATAERLAGLGAVPDRLLQTHAGQIPRDLVARLSRQVGRPPRHSGALLVRGLLAPLAAKCGPTPAHWSAAPTGPMDLALVLVAAALGQVFGWAGQQDGRLVHNIVPSQGYENLQVGASSSVPLEWHTEDAFHPGRASLLMLACVRNPAGVGTRIASVRELGLPREDLIRLGRPVVRISPDASYPATGSGPGTTRPGVPTVWWAPDGPCLRYDPAYSTRSHDDPAFEESYRSLAERLEQKARSVPMGAGDLALIDNDVAVHGRVPFTPRYDGTDRWLKRIMVRLPSQRPEAERREDGYGQVDIVLPTTAGAVR